MKVTIQEKQPSSVKLDQMARLRLVKIQQKRKLRQKCSNCN